ncbi:splicing factor, Prp19-binding domain-containing protein [Cyathus striatus]|nr:splicing factor, Prp19-binding domain-containing protein [Cyathus striatus]
MSTIRKQAPRLPRPAARYWKGKAPKGVAEVESDSDIEEGLQENGDILVEGNQDIVQDYENNEDDDIPLRAGIQKSKTMNVSLKDVSVSKEGKVIVAGREESGRTALEEYEEDEDSDEEESEEARKLDSAGESSEYETESDEDETPRQQFRPVFVPKRARATIAEREALAQETEEALRRKELEAEERRKQSHDMVAESIKRELAEKEKEELVPDVDDTDGLDPEGDLRLGEREEVERRRAMPEEQRLKEDLERAQKLREEKPKGQQKFLQKYWHKGAFHQDEEILKRHDYTEATESTVDVSLLPKVMQVKNFGKRSRTKYTHLLDQDTTVMAGGANPSKTSDTPPGCFNCGGPHLKKGTYINCPQLKDLPMHQRDSTRVLQSSSVKREHDQRSWNNRREENGRREYGRRGNYSSHPDRASDYHSSRRAGSRSRSPSRRLSYTESKRPYRRRSRSRERFGNDSREKKRRRVD